MDVTPTRCGNEVRALGLGFHLTSAVARLDLTDMAYISVRVFLKSIPTASGNGDPCNIESADNPHAFLRSLKLPTLGSPLKSQDSSRWSNRALGEGFRG